jgi:hypothetical protein
MLSRLSSNFPRTRLAAMLAASTLFGVLSLAPSGAALGDEDERNEAAVKLLTTIPYPADLHALHAFDISWVDADTQLYYLGDRSNASVDVFDVKHNRFVKTIKAGFKGVVFNSKGAGNNDESGPNGVVVSGRWLFVTDAPSRVVAIDLTTDKKVSEVSTGGEPGVRADELAFDPEGGVILAVNNADDPPFATLIKVDTNTGKLTLGKRITFKNFGPGADTATNGAEQPVWDPGTGRFYISIPEINGPGDGTGQIGAVAQINPHTGAVEATFHVRLCQPGGLTLGPKQDLLIGCSVVFDTAGKVWNRTNPTSIAAPTQIIIDANGGTNDASVAGVGGSDEVWFNRGDRRYYTASRNNPTGPVLGVIDAESQTLVQIVPTVNAAGKANVFPAGSAHSVAVNPHNNHALVPLPANNVVPSCTNGCIAVYGTSKRDD